MMSDGRDSVVTAIMNERTTPRAAPLLSRASATGIVPKISAYTGIPAAVARITANGLSRPRILTINSPGIQLCISAPIATPMSTYGATFPAMATV